MITAALVSLLVALAAPPELTPVRALAAYLAQPARRGVDLSEGTALADLAQQPFATAPLSRQEAQQAADMLWKAYAGTVRGARVKELKSGALTVNAVRMPFAYTTYGTPPASQKGRSLWISMHGGGGAPAQVNDQQWENQKKLYKPSEGIYVAPRAPTNEWNLWHIGHIDSSLRA